MVDSKMRDWKAAFFDKKWILLILIPLAITVFVRLQPMNLIPMERAAESNVLNYYRSQIQGEIEKNYPNVPSEQRSIITDKRLKELLESKEGEVIAKQIEQNSELLKSRLQYKSGEKTYHYLGDLDSYYWLRMSRNIIEKGTQCDLVENDVCYDTYTRAPLKSRKSIDYYPIVIVAVYRTVRFFDRDLSLMQASFLTPLFFSLLLTIPLFLLLRRLGGNIAAVVGTVMVNVNAMFLTRSLGSDSDIVNVFFQAIFLWLAIECFYAQKNYAKYTGAFLAGVGISLYSKFWAGWWYLFDLFIISFFLKAAFIFLQGRYAHKKLQELKKPMLEIAFVVLCFMTAIFFFYGLLFASFYELYSTIAGQFEVLRFKVASNVNLWPNVLTTVAEFNGIGLGGIMSSFGEILKMPVFLMVIIGMLFIIFPTMKFIKKNIIAFLILLIFNFFIYFYMKRSPLAVTVFLLIIPIFIGMYLHIKIEEEFHPGAIFLLTIIICLVTYFTTNGVRFLFLMTIPVATFTAIFAARIIKIVLSTLRSMVHFPKLIYYVIIVSFITIFLINPVKAGISTSQNYLPMVDDGWVETLDKIKNESKPDAIINSWWDFGHWFKYFADRRVTLDGSSQNSPQLHWLGKMLLTSEEDVCVGILRMLDCGGNEAFDAVNEKMNDTPHSVNILNSIMVENKETAKEILFKHGFNQEESERILGYSHCDPPENFLITSEDMIGKGGVWAHFGSWNFMKSYLSSAINVVPNKEIIQKFKDDYDVSEETTKSWIEERRSLKDESAVNSWIAPWPGYLSGFGGCNQQGNVSVCQFLQNDNKLTFVVEFENKKAYTMIGGNMRFPEKAAFVEEKTFEMVANPVDTIGIGIIVVKNGDSVSVMFVSPELTGSMFTRLFFFDGVGLKRFEKFYDTTSVFGDRIITWKVLW